MTEPKISPTREWKNTVCRRHRTPKGYTVTNLIKSSGLLADARLLLSAWDEEKSTEENFDEALRQNLFGKATRRRVADILRVFRQRFIPGNGSDHALRVFVNSAHPSEVTDPILYYYTALAEPILYDFVTDYLYDRYYVGDRVITVRSGLEFINQAAREGKTEGKWDSSNTRERVARGLLSTLRDFGILEGASRSSEKRIASPRLPVPAFAYIAFHIKRDEPSGERLLKHPHWRLFLLAPNAVERLFAEADAEGLLSYQAAGSIIRIEFPTDDIEEYAHALADRAF